MGFAAQQRAATEHAATIETPAPEIEAAPVVAVTPEPTPEPAARPEPARQEAESAPEVAAESPTLADIRRTRDAVEETRRRVASVPPEAMQFREVPDETKDPVGAIAAMKHNATAQTTRSQVSTAQATAIRQIFGATDKAAAEFRKTTPDYTQAEKHLITMRQESLRELGYGDEQVASQIKHDMFVIARNAIAQGKDPAASIYRLAKAGGYKPTASPVTRPARAQKVTGEKLAKLEGYDFAQAIDRLTPEQEREIFGA